MKQRPRMYCSDSQKALMWERWKQGATLHEIGRLFDRAHSSVHGVVLAETGGIQPPKRRRSSRALRLTEREEISRAVVAGESIRLIADRLGRAASTVSREIKRNGGRAGIESDDSMLVDVDPPGAADAIKGKLPGWIVAPQGTTTIPVPDTRLKARSDRSLSLRRPIAWSDGADACRSTTGYAAAVRYARRCSHPSLAAVSAC